MRNHIDTSKFYELSLFVTCKCLVWSQHTLPLTNEMTRYDDAHNYSINIFNVNLGMEFSDNDKGIFSQNIEFENMKETHR